LSEIAKPLLHGSPVDDSDGLAWLAAGRYYRYRFSALLVGLQAV
jgi:hypothetical protein